MATEYLSDREQEEALRSWWKENWTWVASGIAVGFIVLAVWNYWQRHVDAQGEAAAQVYRELTQAVNANEKDKVDAALKSLETDFKGSPYVDQAHLLLAQAHVNGGRFEMAATELKNVVDKSKDPALAQIAKIRLARVQIQLGHYDEALSLLDVSKAGAFASQVQEVRGDALYAKGDSTGARAAYEAAIEAMQQSDPRRMLNGSDYLQLKLQELPVAVSSTGDQGSTANKESSHPASDAPSAKK